MVSVAVSTLGHIDLFFIDQGTKMNGPYYRDVLLHQHLAIALLFNSTTLLPTWRVLTTVQVLTCETPDFIAPALWPANSPDLNLTTRHGEASHPDA